jgi:membrane protein involved in colicin uptake
MIKFINVLVGFLVLSSLAHSQEIQCQNGRCDVVKKVASVAVAPVVAVSQVVRNESQAVFCRATEPKKRVRFFSRFRLR